MFLQLGVVDTPDNNNRTVKNYWLPYNNQVLTEQILYLIDNPPKTYKQIEKNKLLIILHNRIAIGTKKDINEILITIGY